MREREYFEVTLCTGETFVTDRLDELCYGWCVDYQLALKAMSGDPKDALWGMTGHRISKQEFEERQAETYKD